MKIVACGTSWHAALAGKFMIEKLARIPVEVDYGSEFRYRDPIVSDDTLTVVISQSGETADTLAAQREAKQKGSKTLAICNVVGLDDHARGRRHHLYARRARDRRGFHQGVHLPVDGAVHPGHVSGPGRARRSTKSTSRCLVQELMRCPASSRRALATTRIYEELAQQAVPRHRFSVPGPRHPFPHRARRRAQAEGDFLHPRRRLSGRRDEARAQRADRREAAGGGAGHARSVERREPHALREDALEHSGSEGARRHRDRAWSPRATTEVAQALPTT